MSEVERVPDCVDAGNVTRVGAATDRTPAPGPPGYHALVLAAGAGSRFGGGKLLAAWRGRPLIVAAVATALVASVETVTVVLGSNASAVRDALSATRDPRLRLVVCEDWAQGLSASLRSGVSSLPAGARGAVVFLGDMPAIPRDLADALIAALADGAVVAETVHDGRPAHPIAFAAPMFAAVSTLSGDRGARAILSGVAGIVRIVSDDPGSAFDVDRRRDLGRGPDHVEGRPVFPRGNIS